MPKKKQPDSPNVTLSQPYRVLARKYRPIDFSGLIGQSALVQTLSNAIESDRLAHAFVLTGVRGVGKTTTARIIARALNCSGLDGKSAATITPCGQCDNCSAIANDRHVDVFEMDAASRTGVDGIRDLIESVRYRPTMARYKIYIIDEVHMLSTAAFNALLKTLEEPPEHVKFIFATTEIRKIPVTVLSRCQRFDLRRVDSDELFSHFDKISKLEKVEIEPEALTMICRAADGSVRDGLSLLDQAIAHGAGIVTAVQVRDMLGLADRARIFDLYEKLMRGDLPATLSELGEQYQQGADPSVILEDMLELTHWLTVYKVAPDPRRDKKLPENERLRGIEMAQKLSISTLTRNWQMLLKGLSETRTSSNSLQAAEMVLIRLACVMDLPNPGELVNSLQKQDRSKSNDSGPISSENMVKGPQSSSSIVSHQTSQSYSRIGQTNALAHHTLSLQSESKVLPKSFQETVDLFIKKRELILATALSKDVHLVHFDKGRIDLRLTQSAPPTLANQISTKLQDWTGIPWFVSLSQEQGLPTLRTQKLEKEIEKKHDAAQHPLVKAILETFPHSTIVAVRDIAKSDIYPETPPYNIETLDTSSDDD